MIHHCYYELLEVNNSANCDDLKKAYRKMSLKWHPDKNPENVDEATEIFKQIHQAYKVLSNPHERAWYDKNRERLLSKTVDSEDEIYNLIDNVVYCGFDDNSDGFYAVYRNFFSKLVVNELESLRLRGEKSKETFPDFGDSKSSLEYVVREFYSFWEGFSTKMSFYWHDEHDVDISNSHMYRKYFGKQNQEIRNAAKKEFNRRIREFVVTLKNKDPRVKSYREMLAKKAKDDERKAIEMKHRAWERNQKLYKEDANDSLSGLNTDELNEEIEKIDRLYNNEENFVKENNDILCLACQKTFRSNKAYGNHCKSKNHKKNYEDLQTEIKRLAEAKKNEEVSNSDNSDASELNDEKQSPTIDLKENSDQTKEEKISESKIEEQPNHDSDKEITDSNQSPNLEDESNLIVNNKLSEGENESVKNDDNEGTNEKIKKRRRRPKEEREKTSSTTKVLVDSSLHICQECSFEFPSKNKLFQHIKSTGHATIKTIKPNLSESNKSKRNRK